MTIATIPVDELANLAAQQPIDLIDVRTPAEFHALRAKPAQNFPLDALEPQNVLKHRTNSEDVPLYLICKMGGRSMKACEKFVAAGFSNVVNVTGGTDAWAKAGYPVIRAEKSVMSLDRQVRVAAGSLVVLGGVLSFWQPALVGLAIFVGAGLVFSGVTDTCGMATVLAKMPWNQQKPAATTSSATNLPTLDASDPECDTGG